MAWKMLLADNSVIADVAVGFTSVSVPVSTRAKLLVAVGTDVGKGCEVGLPEASDAVSDGASVLPTLLLGPSSNTVCTAELESEVNDPSGMVVVIDWASIFVDRSRCRRVELVLEVVGLVKPYDDGMGCCSCPSGACSTTTSDEVGTIEVGICTWTCPSEICCTGFVTGATMLDDWSVLHGIVTVGVARY